MEADLAFPTAGEGVAEDEGRAYPTPVTETAPWELGRWVQRCGLPFLPSHFPQRGDGPALCRDLFDPPSESTRQTLLAYTIISMLQVKKLRLVRAVCPSPTVHQ